MSGCCGHRITDHCPCSGLIWGHLGLIISSSAFLFLCFSGASCREGTSMIDLGMKRCPMWRSDWILNRIQDFILNSFWLSLETPKIYSIIYLKKIHIWNLLSLVLSYSSASKWFPLDWRYCPMFLLGATSVYELQQECCGEDLLSSFVAEEQDLKQWVDRAGNKTNLSLPPPFFHLSLSFSFSLSPSPLCPSLPPSPIPNGSVVYRAL